MYRTRLGFGEMCDGSGLNLVWNVNQTLRRLVLVRTWRFRSKADIQAYYSTLKILNYFPSFNHHAFCFSYNLFNWKAN